MIIFDDRRDAGKQLAEKLLSYKANPDAVILGLARGGVVVAAEVALVLSLPLDVLVIRKVGAPGNPELAIGAVGERGQGVFNAHIIDMLEVSSQYLEREVARQRAVLKERLAMYRRSSQALDVKGKVVILIDDGIATGASMRAAIQSLRDAAAKKIVLAVPVAAPDSLKQIAPEVDEVICLSAPVFFEAVGSFYRSFEQTSDQEVMQLLSFKNFKTEE